MQVRNWMKDRKLSVGVLQLGMAGLIVAATSCSSGPAPAPVATAPQYHTEITIAEIMDSVVDPSADFVWAAVSTEVGPKGVVEKAPHTDEEWKVVRRNIVAVMEAANMLKIPGREVAPPGVKSTTPGIEEEPADIKKLIDGDRATWNKSADGLYEAAAILLKAADAKNSEAILDAGNKLDEACESCHLKYWYPKQTEILQRDLANQPDPRPGSMKKK